MLGLLDLSDCPIDDKYSHLAIPAELAAQMKLTVLGTRMIDLDGKKMHVPYVGPVEFYFAGRAGFCGAIVTGDRVVVGRIPRLDIEACGNQLCAIEEVRLRSIGVEEELLAEEGGALSAHQFAKALGVSLSSVQKFREHRTIIAVPNGVRTFRYPAWQIHNRRILPGLAETIKALGDLEPLGICTYFLTPAEAFDDKRPLDLLRAGNVEKVIPHARHHGDRR